MGSAPLADDTVTKRATTAPQWVVESGRLGKQLFTSPKLAREAARRTSRSHGAPVQHYRCTVCDGWHVGGKNKTR